MPQLVNFRALLDSTNRDSAFWNRAASIDTQPFAVETGFHIYGELNLTLKLTAATDTEDAAKLLRILQEYVVIAESCAGVVGAELLEVQGERIHLLLPAPQVTKESVDALLRFCVAFTNTVYARIKKLAGENFRGFKMGADHGRAVLVISGTQANTSLISLGVCANAPAKQLRLASPGTVRMRTEHYKIFGALTEWREWTNITVKADQGVLTPVTAEDLFQKFATAADADLKASNFDQLKVRYGNREYLKEALKSHLAESIKTQGFGFRADLDGFSKQVAEAKTDSQILELVRRFLKILAYPDSFSSRLGNPVIKLPWAGDCVNLVILLNGDAYDDAREFLPVKAASEWHSQMSGQDAGKISWSNHVNGASWAIGVAGGDDREGSNGFILVAPLKGKRRNFLVAAGWGIGRSLDAQECDDVKGGDTVLHEIDYRDLGSTHKVAFSQLRSNKTFWSASGLTKDKVREGGAKVLAPKTATYVAGVSSPIYVPKPSKNAI